MSAAWYPAHMLSGHGKGLQDQGDQADLPSLEPGLYQYYGGGFCYVLGVARDLESGQPMVVFADEAANLYTLPYASFNETLTDLSGTFPRLALKFRRKSGGP